MKLFFDLFSIVLFFVVYKFAGIYPAVLAAIVAYVVQFMFSYIKHRKIDKIHLISLILILVLGGATLVFQNELFFKWKPTVIYWLFAIVFLGSHFIGEKPIIQRLAESNIELPRHVWLRLNVSWVLFFMAMGCANLYVAYHFSLDYWVNFKLFGIIGLTLVFIVIQAVYMSLHLKHDENKRHDK